MTLSPGVIVFMTTPTGSVGGGAEMPVVRILAVTRRAVFGGPWHGPPHVSAIPGGYI